MKKYLVDFLRDFGIEPTFLVMSISILIIISITALIIHTLLHKIILKAIIKVNQRKQNLITSTLLEENLYQRLSLLFQGLVVNWQTKIWVESGYIYETLMTLSLVWISIFTLLVIYSIIDKIFSRFFKRFWNRTNIFGNEHSYFNNYLYNSTYYSYITT